MNRRTDGQTKERKDERGWRVKEVVRRKNRLTDRQTKNGQTEETGKRS
jgi:hypothetical protein